MDTTGTQTCKGYFCDGWGEVEQSLPTSLILNGATHVLQYFHNLSDAIILTVTESHFTPQQL